MHADARDVLEALAHKLGSPLGAIVNYAYLLGEDLTGRLSATEREWLQRVVEAAARARMLLTEARAYVEALSRPLSPRPLALGLVLERVRRSHAETDGATIEVDEDDGAIEVVADPDGLASALDNLLGVALALSPQQGPPRCGLSVRAEGGRVRLRLKAPDGLRSPDLDPERALLPFATLPSTDAAEDVELGSRHAAALILIRRLGGEGRVEATTRGLTWHLDLPAAAS